ncbi:MAG: GMP synthase-like glutamine amidotransferase [Gammaproteobacteria bacterium]|jgi:GMP synthase-like glutamine amidotransferase
MKSKQPRIAVLQLGMLPVDLAATWPNYGQMIINWLSGELHEVEYQTLSIVEGEALPAPDEYDGVVYSGSRHGVYDELPWIEPLKVFVRATAKLGRPQFGICFGHQLMAQAFGGRAEKSSSGWGCGVQQYAIDDGAGETRKVNVLVMHQDQVHDLPIGANLLGGSDFCRNGVIEYRQAARSVQFHPEFSAAYLAELLRIYGGSTFSTTVADSAAATLGQELRQELVAQWVARFFRHHFGSGDSSVD